MIETTWVVLAVCGFAVYALGLVSGIVLHYFLEYRPLHTRYGTLVKQLLNLKKQGFVPQFEVENPRELDPSEGIAEY